MPFSLGMIARIAVLTSSHRGNPSTFPSFSSFGLIIVVIMDLGLVNHLSKLNRDLSISNHSSCFGSLHLASRGHWWDFFLLLVHVAEGASLDWLWPEDHHHHICELGKAIYGWFFDSSPSSVNMAIIIIMIFIGGLAWEGVHHRCWLSYRFP